MTVVCADRPAMPVIVETLAGAAHLCVWPMRVLAGLQLVQHLGWVVLHDVCILAATEAGTRLLALQSGASLQLCILCSGCLKVRLCLGKNCFEGRVRRSGMFCIAGRVLSGLAAFKPREYGPNNASEGILGRLDQTCLSRRESTVDGIL